MSNWVKCTRRSDEGAMYLNLDTVERMRWNDAESCTIVVWPGGKDKFVRVLESPEDILGAEHGGSVRKPSKS